MISQETLSEIAGKIITADVDESILSSLRAGYPDLHFTYCCEDDISNSEPMLEQERFHLYLVDGRDHCLCLTRDFETATGIVVAEIYQD